MIVAYEKLTRSFMGFRLFHFISYNCEADEYVKPFKLMTACPKGNMSK